MRRVLVTVTLAVLGVSAVFAQSPASHGAARDPDKKVAGPGALPSGWKGRLDSGDKTLAGVKATPMGGGIHFMTGPAGIYYKPADKMAGAYEAHATFTQMEPAAHPEAYGLIIGGADLEGAGQKYTYFIVRQDGKFMIKRRAGAETPTVADWTDSAAIKKPDAKGRMINTLSIDVVKDKVHFLVNGAEVLATDASKVDAAGIAGLRVNHNLNLHVEGFAAKAR